MLPTPQLTVRMLLAGLGMVCFAEPIAAEQPQSSGTPPVAVQTKQSTDVNVGNQGARIQPSQQGNLAAGDNSIGRSMDLIPLQPKAALPPNRSSDEGSLKLGSRGGGTRRANGPKEHDSPVSSIYVVCFSLAAVLGLFFLIVWIFKKTSPQATSVLPGEVVDVLGRAALAGRQQIHLVRFGSKLVLLSDTPTGIQTLAEIVDPQEVERLVAICQQKSPGGVTETFRQILTQLGSEPTSGSFTGDDLDLAGTRTPAQNRL